MHPVHLVHPILVHLVHPTLAHPVHLVHLVHLILANPMHPFLRIWRIRFFFSFFSFYGHNVLQSAWPLRHLSKHLWECLTMPSKSLNRKLLDASLIRVINISFSRNLLHFTLLLTTDQNCLIGVELRQIWRQVNTVVATRFYVFGNVLRCRIGALSVTR